MGKTTKTRKPFYTKPEWFIPILITILLALTSPLWGHKLYYFFFGEFIIDYKENDIITKEGVTYAKIEVLNRLGRPLLYVNGTVTLNCSDIGYQYNSKTFRLEEKRDFLGEGERSEFLFAPDPLFVNLVQTKNFHCSDAVFEFAEYIKINESHSKLNDITAYEFFIDNDGLSITKKQYKAGEIMISRTCLYCDVVVNIYATNIDEPFSESESHKFVGGATSVSPFPDIMKTPSNVTPIFSYGHGGRLTSFRPCNNLTNEECAPLLCEKIKEKYEDFIIDCDTYKRTGFILTTNPFRNKSIRILGGYEEVNKAINTTISSKPQSVDNLYRHAINLYDSGKLDECLEVLDNIIRINPNHETTLNTKGTILAKMGRPEESLPYFDKALQINPNNSQALLNRGLAYAYLGQSDKGMKDVKKSIAIDPNNPCAWVNLGSIYYTLNLTDEAIGALDRALELDPKHIGAWNNKYIILDWSSRHKEAELVMESAANMNPPIYIPINLADNKQTNICD